MNQLLTQNQFIPFNRFTAEDLDNALTICLEQTQHSIKQVEQQSNISWQLLSDSVHISLYKLNQLWGIVHHLLAVNDSPQLRALQDKFQPLISEFYVNLGQNEKLFQHYKYIKQHEYASLPKEAQKIVDNEFRDFFLSGIELESEQKARFKTIQNQLTELTTKFEQHLLDATDSYVKFVTREELKGVPEDIIAMYNEQAIASGKPDLFKLSLHIPSYLPIMQYCDNRKLREELYYQYVTRASELGNVSFDNTPIIQQIIKLRQEKAQLLGFPTYAALSLYTKMADTTTQVLDFLFELANKSKAQALEDMAELTRFAQDTAGINHLTAWDIAYFSEKLQQQKYSYSNNELKQYFQLPTVLDGLFKLIAQLYQIEFRLNSTIPTWHKDMLTYDVLKDGLVIGNLYLDLFARKGKQSGAWMNSAQDKHTYRDEKFNPMAYIICNFTNPIGNKPSLLTFDEVQTLFHEMGHALHHLLTQRHHFAISGINGVEWDAVELPSQFMEYFTWNYAILSTITKHITTGQTLPLEFYNKLLNSRFYQSGLQMLRQLEFAIFDILLHSETNVASLDYLRLLDQVRQQVAVITPPKYNRFPNTFSHIFAGSYAAGYYSYKWAEVLATDIFSVFDEVTQEHYKELGQKFLGTILSQGGLNPMLENFKAFMGREPQINALLKYSGIKS